MSGNRPSTVSEACCTECCKGKVKSWNSAISHQKENMDAAMYDVGCVRAHKAHKKACSYFTCTFYTYGINMLMLI